MKTKTKPFDCVEMKRRAQKKLLDEYQARRKEFTTFAEFIHAVAQESPWIRSVRARMRGQA